MARRFMRPWLTGLLGLAVAVPVFAQSPCRGPAGLGQSADPILVAAWPDCTTITTKSSCESTVCARHGVTCHWDATQSTKCTCVTSSVVSLVVSEYLEGSLSNQALEIFNGTGKTVDLAAEQYSVQFFFNGSKTAGRTLSLTGTLADGEAFVLANSASSAFLLALADQTAGGTWFNGDDVVVLRQGSAVVDSIGQLGSDPGAEWGSGTEKTANSTLRRDVDVCRGDSDPDGTFDPAVEWTGAAQDTLDDLGSYSTTCGTAK